MMKRMTRRGFLKMVARGSMVAGFAGLTWGTAGCGPTPEPTRPGGGLSPATATPPGESLALQPSPTAEEAKPVPSPTPPLPSPTPPAPSPSLPPTHTPEQPTATPFPSRSPRTFPTPAPAGLAIMHGSDPEAITRAAIAALGGMGRFVKKGDEVIVKPNTCVSHRAPEYAATTNPEVVGALVRMCLEAGAREVRVMDYPFSGTAKAAYVQSGIQEAVEQAGGRMEIMANMKYQEVPIPEGRDIKVWTVYPDVLEVDVLIDVPIAKHHGSARLTLGMKNLMGVIKDRPKFHWNLGQRIADLTSLVMPDLTVMDAVRMLMQFGPTGGRLEDVRRADTVIASPDIVAVDSYTATLFGLRGADIDYVRIGHEMGLGEIDFRKLKFVEENIA